MLHGQSSLHLAYIVLSLCCHKLVREPTCYLAADFQLNVCLPDRIGRRDANARNLNENSAD